MDEEIETATNVLVMLGSVAAAVVVAFVLGTVISALVRRAGRTKPWADDLSRHMRRPVRAVLVVVAVWIAVRVSTDPSVGWRSVVEHLLLIALIITGAWLAGALAFVLEDRALSRFRTDVPDNRHARRVRTQITVVRRLTVSVLVVCAFSGILLTFPEARAAGASLLASAGLISIVAGMAAQTSLANVFAGMQIAFTDGIRVDDVVVLEGEWGRIEEITMTYVVVHLWDDRRLIMPSTYFTTTPYQNWTRRAADLLGTVELDLDFRVPVGEMRTELKRLLGLTELWDERVGILQVTEATGGTVRVRALVSAHDAPTLFDLRCFVREGLVDWLQRDAPGALPRTRLEGGVAAQVEDAAPVEKSVDTSAPVDLGEPVLPDDAPSDGTVAAPGRGDREQPAPPERPRIPRRTAVRRAVPDDVVETLLLEPVNDGPAPADRSSGTREVPAAAESAMFTGSLAAVERSRAFTGPGQDVIDEREEHAAEDGPHENHDHHHDHHGEASRG
ncbi:mechanosensitive ion channel family protein [Oerskovia flava]|uniref:mechanosensitive ion channel family protein n=1 Tax=Oerskovia flava TaxID=2986422 RepID=UPI002AD36723|nr:mechanosensitive ion channel domain-containing protein [Oerskovia sp. JB1-3-2]